MLTTKKILVLLTAMAFLGGLPCEAKGKTETQTSSKPSVPKKSYAISSTTGWRKINGWEKDVTDRDPNLAHWNWLSMQEMEKNYVRLRPGQVGTRRQSRYTRPVRMSAPRKTRVSHYGLAAPGPDGRYTRPVDAPLPTRQQVATRARLSAPLPTREQVATMAKLNAPRTNLRYAAPDTRARLSAPSTNVRLAAPTTAVRLAAPSTAIRLAAPSTAIRLAAPETRAQLASTNTGIRLNAKKPPTDEMSDCGHGYADDSFQSPELVTNPYGPSTHHSYGYASTSSNVRANLVKKRR